MNKYQEALDSFEETFRNATLDDDLTNERQDLLQELVDKATPMKPIVQTFKRVFGGGGYIDKFFCPYCKSEVKENEHHCRCGQAIDWDEE